MEDVKANIKGMVVRLHRFHSPAEGGGGFEQGDLMTVLLATECNGQSSQASTNHSDVHPSASDV